MTFTDFIDVDISANALVIKKYDKEINCIIKLNNSEIEEIKIKKDAISFFTISTNLNNPIKPEFSIILYTLNNYTIELICEGDDKKILEELKEFIKSILI